MEIDLRKVLVVSNFFPPRTVGGAEIVAYRQARALQARGHRVTILAGDLPSESSPPGTLNLEDHDGMQVYRLALHSLEPDVNFFWPAAARRLCAIIAANGIEVVHFHNLMGLGANLIRAAKDAGAMCMVTLHDHWGFCFRQTRLRPDGALCEEFDECAGCKPAIEPPGGTALPMRLRRDYVAWCLGQADCLVTPSRYLASAYERAGFPSERLQVISNGIDLGSIPNTARKSGGNGTLRFLCSAYLGEHKGIPVLLEAMKRLVADNSVARNWEVIIAGEGHLRPQVEKAASGELSGHLRFVGRIPRSELLDVMSRAEVAVLPSIWPENEPVTMLEAIALGVGQLATRTGGNLELVEEPESGFLVSPGDAGALAEAMRRYIRDPELARQQGAYNLRRREQFDENNSIVKIEELLRQSRRTDTTGQVVICGTGWPALEVAALVNHTHKFVNGPQAPRFVWREWADSAAWDDAVLLWLWDRHPEEWLVNCALRRGIPVLAPANPWAEGLARQYGGIILYRTFLEALAAMKMLFTVPRLRSEFAWRAKASATAATITAPSTAFTLLSEVNS